MCPGQTSLLFMSKYLTFLFAFFILYVCSEVRLKTNFISLYVSMCVHILVPTEVRRGLGISWSWSYRWLWATWPGYWSWPCVLEEQQVRLVRESFLRFRFTWTDWLANCSSLYRVFIESVAVCTCFKAFYSYFWTQHILEYCIISSFLWTLRIWSWERTWWCPVFCLLRLIELFLVMSSCWLWLLILNGDFPGKTVCQ